MHVFVLLLVVVVLLCFCLFVSFFSMLLFLCSFFCWLLFLFSCVFLWGFFFPFTDQFYSILNTIAIGRFVNSNC